MGKFYEKDISANFLLFSSIKPKGFIYEKGSKEIYQTIFENEILTEPASFIGFRLNSEHIGNLLCKAR